MGRFTEYQVIGRHLPTPTDPLPKLYRMRLFAPNHVIAKSRFWYFLGKLRKVKRATGEIVSINPLNEPHPTTIKNFGIWLRYDSRSGTHNMYKEFRELSRADAVEACYQDMASRHMARFSCIQVLKVKQVEGKDVRREGVRQMLGEGLKFPLPHRLSRVESRRFRSAFIAKRPSTFY